MTLRRVVRALVCQPLIVFSTVPQSHRTLQRSAHDRLAAEHDTRFYRSATSACRRSRAPCGAHACGVTSKIVKHHERNQSGCMCVQRQQGATYFQQLYARNYPQVEALVDACARRRRAPHAAARAVQRGAARVRAARGARARVSGAGRGHRRAALRLPGRCSTLCAHTVFACRHRRVLAACVCGLAALCTARWR